MMRIMILTPDDLHVPHLVKDASLRSFGVTDNSSEFDLVGYLYDSESVKVLINRTGICTTSHYISQKEFESLVSLWIVKKNRKLIEDKRMAEQKAIMDEIRAMAAEHDIEISFPHDLVISDEHTKETDKPIFIRQTKAREITEDIEKFITFIQTENISKTAREMIRDILEK